MSDSTSPLQLMTYPPYLVYSAVPPKCHKVLLLIAEEITHERSLVDYVCSRLQWCRWL